MLPNRSTNPIQPEPVSMVVAKIVLAVLLTFIVITSLFMAWIYFYQQHSYNEQVHNTQEQTQTLEDSSDETIIIPQASIGEISEKEIVE